MLLRFVYFSQYRNIDHSNHIYQQIEEETAFFKIMEVDTSAKIVKGNFCAKFKRKSSGLSTTDSYLPDILSFQGDFHAKYTDTEY